ncbi:class I SAM-dependent methyltransferase [Aminobacter sp. Piv2-1]|uniref:class I SAM-dependent methyltransferase n=1 Tax=Aminobacter sp. Piv2-1 TaxID=3031122 RepID=UPI0030EB5E4C
MVDFRTTSDPREIAQLAQASKSQLAELFFSKRDSVSLKWHHYLDVYDRYLSPYRTREQPLRFLEIGIAEGGSFQIWRSYFGPEAILFGIDIDAESASNLNTLGINCCGRAGDQADPVFLRRVVEEMGGLDIVIDDGSHVAEHQIATFRTLFPLLSNGGMYLCEDLHTAYWGGQWQGGLKKPGTFIEVTKDIIDCLHSWYAPIANDLSDMELHRSVPAIHIHDSLVVIEKAHVDAPVMIIW